MILIGVRTSQWIIPYAVHLIFNETFLAWGSDFDVDVVSSEDKSNFDAVRYGT